MFYVFDHPRPFPEIVSSDKFGLLLSGVNSFSVAFVWSWLFSASLELSFSSL